jgi:hypothetical protein
MPHSFSKRKKNASNTQSYAGLAHLLIYCLPTYLLWQNLSTDMQILNKWSGIHTKGESSFHAGHPPGGSRHTQQICFNCFNCGGNNHIEECTKPCDKNRINQKAAEFRAMIIQKKQEDRKGNGGGMYHDRNNKWAPALPHKNSKQVIDGKPMFYLKFRKCWVPDKAQAGKQVDFARKKKKKKVEQEEDPAPDDIERGPGRVL